KYNITFDARTHVAGRRISVGQSGGNMTKVKLTTTVETYDIVYEANTDNAFSIFIHDGGTYEIGNIKVVETNAVSQAQLSVLNDNINMRVSKGELMSQINIEAGRTLIQSDKLYLDSSSVVFSGKAFIPGAVIENASIDGAKIANATIGSAKIANLDVNKSSGNKAQLVKAGFNGISSSLTIDYRGLTIKSATSWDMELINNGIRVTDKYGKASG